MIKLITVRDGETGPVVYMWVDGKEVGHVELTTRATANLISDLAKRIVEKPKTGRTRIHIDDMNLLDRVGKSFFNNVLYGQFGGDGITILPFGGGDKDSFRLADGLMKPG